MARKQWSANVTRSSNALDQERGVLASADRSKRRKSSPFRSAMSMLTFYINRAGKHLSKKRLRVLERAKNALRAEYGRPPATKRA